MTTAADGEAGLRLDKLLAQAHPDLSRTRIKALIEANRVSADGATITDPSWRVKPGQTFAIFVPEAEPAHPQPQAMDLRIMFEDEHLLVIDKPAGLVVHPAPGNADQTLVNALLAHCGDSLSGIGGVRRPGIVHRIDKDTSGLLLVAKNDAAHHGLSAQLAAHSLTRAYHAVVWGVPQPRTGEIEGAIGRSPANRKKMAVVQSGGKTALTRYKVLKVLGGGIASLVECRLATGRTHQIRVHMASIGHTLVGDQLYGRSRSLAQAALTDAQKVALRSFPRQALHAYLIGFSHPKTSEMHAFLSTTPNDIMELIHILDRI